MNAFYNNNNYKFIIANVKNVKIIYIIFKTVVLDMLVMSMGMTFMDTEVNLINSI